MQNPLEHIAIIMDGNNRWAMENGIGIDKAYKKGSEAAEKTINYCAKVGIKYLTLYGFSLENWNRPQGEIDLIMEIFKEAILGKLEEVTENNIRVMFIGDRYLIKEDILSAMEKLEEKSKNNRRLLVRIAISYGSRSEIIKAGETASNMVDIPYEEAFKLAINPYNIPDPDLLIRSSGEIRISNFLLWEIAYSELYFTKTFWPDFNEEDLQLAIDDFNLRKRRFGLRQSACTKPSIGLN
jgi:undecaprenyl diphosphate synthase